LIDHTIAPFSRSNFLADDLADLPVQVNQRGVNGLNGALLGAGNELNDVGKCGGRGAGSWLNSLGRLIKRPSEYCLYYHVILACLSSKVQLFFALKYIASRADSMPATG
jgi:hypothetical protein